MCCGNKFCCSENKKCFCLQSKTFTAFRTQILRPKHMFPSLATQGNITNKNKKHNISAKMFPSLARPVKSLNMEILRCHLADYVREFYQSACRTCSTIIPPHSTNQIIVFWSRRCRGLRPCLSSLKIWRLQCQRQRHKSMNWSVEWGKIIVLHVRHALWCNLLS